MHSTMQHPDVFCLILCCHGLKLLGSKTRPRPRSVNTTIDTESVKTYLKINDWERNRVSMNYLLNSV